MPRAPLLQPELLSLLRGVSRSFYLSIRVLPGQLRLPIAVGYLLARATDTIADTSRLPADERAARLDALIALIEAPPDPEAASLLAAAVLPYQDDIHERALLMALPECLHWLDELQPPDKADVRQVLRHITRGQKQDVLRFASPGQAPIALPSASDLHEYTWLVAGCVGEFWTRLCVRHLPNFANLHEREMRSLGQSFGQALQLVNILRDLSADLANGRCYLPADELSEVGITPATIAERPEALAPIWSRWMEQAQQGLDDGMGYADAVNSARVRAASALPALLGARTLALLREAGVRGSMERKVKMERREVRAVMLRLALTLGGRDALWKQFMRLRGAGDTDGWDNPRP
ncbi:squalene/phytoene synthase family protein [Caenimonas sp. SL110]|uniref:phytoene/squalene synthase family protein n=1 Tax=Caenimonas sp. SL110 TaxID=1450524 RepID=UPI000653363A|nr:squalene/phytoene synthase family protein [Caenimonas sp. SL110]